jgi:hypothetical protein
MAIGCCGLMSPPEQQTLFGELFYEVSLATKPAIKRTDTDHSLSA